MEINGLEVHTGYVVSAAVWIVVLIGMWLVVATILHRFATRGSTKTYRRAMKVRLTQVVVMTVATTFIAVDSAEIFVDGYGYVNLAAIRMFLRFGFRMIRAQRV